MRLLTPLVAVALVALLAACGPGPGLDPVPVPLPPEPTATPVFASDAEALAAAHDRYIEYIAVSDAISAEGGRDPERIEPYVTEEKLTQELEDIEEFARSGKSFDGSGIVQSFELQRYEEPDLIAYVWYDVTEVRVLDDSGLDITPEDRPNRVQLEIAFELVGGVFRVARSDLWSTSC